MTKHQNNAYTIVPATRLSAGTASPIAIATKDNAIKMMSMAEWISKRREAGSLLRSSMTSVYFRPPPLLRRHFSELEEPAQRQTRASLEAHGCWEPLWRVEDPASGVDPEGEAPFARGHSMTGLEPHRAPRARQIRGGPLRMRLRV